MELANGIALISPGASLSIGRHKWRPGRVVVLNSNVPLNVFDGIVGIVEPASAGVCDQGARSAVTSALEAAEVTLVQNTAAPKTLSYSLTLEKAKGMGLNISLPGTAGGGGAILNTASTASISVQVENSSIIEFTDDGWQQLLAAYKPKRPAHENEAAYRIKRYFGHECQYIFFIKAVMTATKFQISVEDSSNTEVHLEANGAGMAQASPNAHTERKRTVLQTFKDETPFPYAINIWAMKYNLNVKPERIQDAVTAHFTQLALEASGGLLYQGPLDNSIVLEVEAEAKLHKIASDVDGLKHLVKNAKEREERQRKEEPNLRKLINKLNKLEKNMDSLLSDILVNSHACKCDTLIELKGTCRQLLVNKLGPDFTRALDVCTLDDLLHQEIMPLLIMPFTKLVSWLAEQSEDQRFCISPLLLAFLERYADNKMENDFQQLLVGLRHHHDCTSAGEVLEKEQADPALGAERERAMRQIIGQRLRSKAAAYELVRFVVC